jgi:site-specific DNA-methyltransferase (adenine-specific)
MFSVNTIFHENCIETLHRLEDEVIDMTITSPPYDDLREYNGYHFPVEEIAASLFPQDENWRCGDMGGG